jgi:hypothetical protein
MKHHESPFAPGWWGIPLDRVGLAAVRPSGGTYALTDYALLPDPPADLDGAFTWLSSTPARRGDNIGIERAKQNARSLRTLTARCERDAVALPPAFLTFARSRTLRTHVRSCTDCYLEYATTPVPSPVGDGHLVRFLNDSQGVLFWYLYIARAGGDHAVVAAPWMFGPLAKHFHEEPPNPNDLVFCAESFEVFLWRFWIENALWYTGFDDSPMPADGDDYVACYKQNARRR